MNHRRWKCKRQTLAGIETLESRCLLAAVTLPTAFELVGPGAPLASANVVVAQSAKDVGRALLHDVLETNLDSSAAVRRVVSVAETGPAEAKLSALEKPSGHQGLDIAGNHRGPVASTTNLAPITNGAALASPLEFLGRKSDAPALSSEGRLGDVGSGSFLILDGMPDDGNRPLEPTVTSPGMSADIAGTENSGPGGFDLGSIDPEFVTEPVRTEFVDIHRGGDDGLQTDLPTLDIAQNHSATAAENIASAVGMTSVPIAGDDEGSRPNLKGLADGGTAHERDVSTMVGPNMARYHAFTMAPQSGVAVGTNTSSVSMGELLDVSLKQDWDAAIFAQWASPVDAAVDAGADENAARRDADVDVPAPVAPDFKKDQDSEVEVPLSEAEEVQRDRWRVVVDIVLAGAFGAVVFRPRKRDETLQAS